MWLVNSGWVVIGDWGNQFSWCLTMDDVSSAGWTSDYAKAVYYGAIFPGEIIRNKCLDIGKKIIVCR